MNSKYLSQVMMRARNSAKEAGASLDMLMASLSAIDEAFKNSTDALGNSLKTKFMLKRRVG